MIENGVRTGVRACAEHPAVLCYVIGNEIPAPIVRWYGRRRVERFLERLHRAGKAEDAQGLVTYVNYPTTEYLICLSSTWFALTFTWNRRNVWEWSGWGTPVVDWTQSLPGFKRFSADPDLITYWSVVRDYWPGVQAQSLGRLALVGTVLRLLDAIYWAALGLAYEWVESSVRCLSVYEAGLADAIRTLNAET